MFSEYGTAEGNARKSATECPTSLPDEQIMALHKEAIYSLCLWQQIQFYMHTFCNTLYLFPNLCLIGGLWGMRLVSLIRIETTIL